MGGLHGVRINFRKLESLSKPILYILVLLSRMCHFVFCIFVIILGFIHFHLFFGSALYHAYSKGGERQLLINLDA